MIAMGITMIFSVLPVIQVSLLYRPTALRKKLSSFALYVHAPEVELILKSLDPKKATGYDKIPPRTLRDGADALAYPLSVLINKIIDSGSVPAAWKLAEICPIFKKDDPHDKSNYRPVSILVTLDKVFEKCLARQLSDYFSSILSPFLSGYRRGYGCEAVLLRLIEDWRECT